MELPNDGRRFWKVPKPEPNVFSSLKYELAAFALSARLIVNRRIEWHPGMMWSKSTLDPLYYSYNTRSVWLDLCSFQERIEPILYGIYNHIGLSNPRPGRLTCTLTGAGKRRLFAIGNFVRQRLLHPVHDWAMRVLSRMPMDGTFNQKGPIDRLSRMSPSDILYYDLSSATDRFPVVVLEAVFTRLFGRAMSSCVVSGSLWWNVFWTHRPLLKKARYISFAAGQP
ncbi:hypothetical protein ZIOFF_074382 (mitochondrion) [Zingiber officinale]|uniref:Uncharacterized protein n=1 Tax=Zingiber officinale TaxID=94328 RepID=A0A8J5BV93_ZINOF|nr:hypothetical protein ZIOFF_074382 [Zingiber officinale]